ncbi:MAG TPA: hypothetical protein VD947_00440 [Patescibacteria group bacterium]|nr:hypothetical protein [Patescibacteria group bacterium]
MSRESVPENCLDIVGPFQAELDRLGLADSVQIMGGIGSAAMKHAGTEIILDERRMVVAPDFLEDDDIREALDPIRNNGTRRDIDALVLSSDGDLIDRVEKATDQTIEDKLDKSIFVLIDAAHLQEQIDNPFGIKALKTFVSDRYIYTDGSIDKSLFPFAVPLDPESLESWELEVNGQIFMIANPAAAILNYLTRSISGLRPKDYDKVQEMAGLVFGKAPELAEWMVDGPGKSQMELAAITQTLRRSNSWPLARRELNIGGGVIAIKAGSVRALKQNEAFMLSDADSRTQDAALMIAMLKARGLGIPESNETLVKLFQKFIERGIDTITKNK